MADRSTRLTIRVLLDAAGATGDLRQLGDSSQGIGDKFAKIAAAGAAFAGVTAFIKGAAEAASNLQQSTGGVEAVFKSSAGAVKAWGAQAASTIGLSQSAYQDLATLIGSQLKNAGTSMEELGPKTNTLINQGADLAAMFGGTTAEAVQAMSSALKGERDPIERYGVSLTQAAIDAEIMAEGLDTSTSAAKQAATATATLALITKQTADAQGAAGREADSYASVQQRLAAVWENTMAQIGSALLPALSSLMDGFARIAPVIGDVITPIAELLGWVLQLPAPLLGVVAAMAGWKIFGGSITSALSSFSTKLSEATTSSAGFKSAMAGLGSTLAGGLALAGIGFIISSIVSSMADAKRVTNEWQSDVSALADEIVKAGGSWTTAVTEFRRGQVEASGGFKTLTAAGVSYADAMKVATGSQAEANAVLSANQDILDGLEPAQAVQVLAMNAQGDAAKKLAAEKAAYIAEENKAAAAAGETTAASQQAAAAQAEAAQKQQDAAIKAAQNAAAQTAVKVALDSVKDAASAASTAIDYFVLSMQVAAGMNLTMDQAAKSLNDALRGSADAFKASAEAGGINTDALTSWNVAALTTTSQGSSLYDALIKTQTGYAASTTAAYSNASANGDTAAGMVAASAAADAAYASFITMATGAGLSADQAAALAVKLGIVQGTQLDPKTFELIAQDQQADQAVSDLQAAQIADKTMQVQANVAPATGAIDSTAASAPPATITTGANVAPAASAINSTASGAYKATVSTSANVAPAQSAINSLTGQAYTTTVQVQANISPAAVMINQLVALQRTTTITVNANTDPAMSAIRSVTNGSYSATINVTANTSAASAAIAAIPRSVSVPAPAPAPAALQAFSMMSAFADVAPAVASVAAPQYRYVNAAPSLDLLPQSQSVTYTVNLRGGITDPDGAARAIENVLRRRDRRATTVIAR